MKSQGHTQQRVEGLPDQRRMISAFLDGDAHYDGVFLTGVKTTGIFCRPSCPARKPKPENVEFFDSCAAARAAGYRPCKRCRPLEHPAGKPPWVHSLLAGIDADPTRRWRDVDLLELGIQPERARRWFKQHYGMTFHAYARGRRLSDALAAIETGESVTGAGLDHGFDSLSGFSEAVRRVTGQPPGAAERVIRIRRLDTPLGPMLAGAEGDRLCLLEFADRRALQAQIRSLARHLRGSLVPGNHPMLDRVDDELRAYFDGRLRSFTVPLTIRGTRFQETVWRALLDIPHGQTRSYAELAEAVGRPRAVRAVGTANGANRLAIVVPCHRVIGADGRLSGYGGGVWRKRRLLELEGAWF